MYACEGNMTFWESFIVSNYFRILIDYCLLNVIESGGRMRLKLHISGLLKFADAELL